MTAAVLLDRVTVRFGAFTAVRAVSVEIAAGEFFSFLGPSGCGKTTLLRTVSGLVEPSEGRVLIGGRDMAGIGPNRRPTALIFQNLALFPLMSVAENIAYGLKVRGVPRAARRARVEELLELIALPGAADKRIDELSGGQRQRVAIARALAVEPQVLLLDEPLSALDLKLRQHMRNELRSIQRRVGLTFVYITHDQGEALAMSDRIAVMNHGVIEQVGTGRAVYEEPRTPFVASFVGESNALPGRVLATADGLARVATALGPLAGRDPVGLRVGEEAILFVRPECLLLDPPEEAERIEARAGEETYEGSASHLAFTTADGHRLTLTTGRDGRERPVPGTVCTLGWRARDAIVLAVRAEPDRGDG